MVPNLGFGVVPTLGLVHAGLSIAPLAWNNAFTHCFFSLRAPCRGGREGRCVSLLGRASPFHFPGCDVRAGQQWALCSAPQPPVDLLTRVSQPCSETPMLLQQIQMLCAGRR